MPPKYYGAAAQYNKPAGSPGGGMDLKKLGLIGGLALFVLIILIVGFSIIGNLSKGPQDEFLSLAARTANLQALLDKQKQNLTSGDLKKINAEASTLLLSDSVAIKNAAKDLYGVSEIPEAVNTTESVSDVQDTLDKAKTSGSFDHTYISEIMTKIGTTFDLAKKLRGSVSGKSAKEALDHLMNNLTAIDDQLSNTQL